MKLLLAGAAMAGLIATAVIAQDVPPGPRGSPMHERMHAPMTRGEVEAKVAEHFAMVDADHDGVVTRPELDAFLAKRRVAWEAKRKEHRDHRFDRLDKNKDGKLSRAEYDSPPPPGGPRPDMASPAGPEGPGGPRGPGRHGGPGGWRHRHHPHGMMGPRWFEMADADHDGRVTLAEAKAAALAHFDRLDTNHDGTLSPDEMRAAWHGRRGGPDGPRGPRGPGRHGDAPPPPGGTPRGPGYDLPATPAAAPST